MPSTNIAESTSFQPADPQLDGKLPRNGGVLSHVKTQSLRHSDDVVVRLDFAGVKSFKKIRNGSEQGVRAKVSISSQVVGVPVEYGTDKPRVGIQWQRRHVFVEAAPVVILLK